MSKLRSGIFTMLLTANKEVYQKKGQNTLFVVINTKPKEDNVYGLKRQKNNKVCRYQQ